MTVRVGVLGYGNVGAELVRQLTERSTAIAARTGITLQVTRVAVRDISRRRPGVSRRLLVATPAEVVAASDVDVVVELIGGIEPARAAILDALRAGTGHELLQPASGGDHDER